MNKNNLNIGIVTGYIVLALWIIFTGLENQDYYPVTQGFVALSMLPIPFLITKIFKLSVNTKVLTTYYLFCLLSILCGSALRWYKKFPEWDKVLHFTSGFLIAFSGIALFNLWKKIDTLTTKEDFLFFCLYTISFTFAGAVVWEFYEYALYVFLGIDALNVSTTGVHDTIQDMLICGLGGILSSLWAIRLIKKNKIIDFIEVRSIR